MELGNVEPEDFEDIEDQQVINREASRIVRAVQKGDYDEQEAIRAINDFVKHRQFMAMRSLGRAMAHTVLEYPQDDPEWSRDFVAHLTGTVLPVFISARYDPELDEDRP